MRGSWVAAKHLHSEPISSVLGVSLSWFIKNPPAAVLSAVGTLFAEVYSGTSVFIKRLVSSSQSPLLSQTSESLKGLAMIRARGGMVCSGSLGVGFTEQLGSLRYLFFALRKSHQVEFSTMVWCILQHDSGQ